MINLKHGKIGKQIFVLRIDYFEDLMKFRMTINGMMVNMKDGCNIVGEMVLMLLRLKIN